MKNKMKILNTFSLTVGLLIILDQVSKLFFQPLIGNEYVIVKDLISIKPFLHRNFYSPTLLNITTSRSVRLLISIFAAYLVITLFRYLKDSYDNSKLLRFSFIFGIAATISSVLDQSIRGGALDFIYLENYFIFDLKDIYINIYVLTLICFTLMNWKRLNNSKQQDFLIYLFPFKKKQKKWKR